MPVNLTAVFKVHDKGSAQLRKLTKYMERMDRASKQVTKSTSTSQKAVRALGTASASAANGMGRLKSSMSGMAGAVAGVAGAYLTAQGAIKAFNATIGEAARYEQSSTIIAAMMNDTQKYQEYLKMIDDIAISSPLLNSADMTAGSKGLLTMTKDLTQLEKAWNTIEKLNAVNPLQGVEGAVYSLKALQSGDVESIVDRFDLNRADVNPLKGLSFAEQISGLDKLLAKMNITEKVVEDMGNTTLGQWNSLKERASTVLRDIGEAPNSRLGDYLKSLNERFENINVKSLANKIGSVLDSMTEKAIKFGEFVWKWREPLAYVVGAVTAALGAFAVVGTIAALANPITLIASGIAAAAVGFKALYDNSEPVRKAIDGLVGKAKALWEAFQNGGTGGLLDRLFGSGTAEKVSGIVGTIKAKIAEFTPFAELFKQTLINVGLTLSDVFTNAWSIISPILSGLWSVLQVVGGVAAVVFNNVIAPALSFLAQLFTTLWSIAQPILTILGALFSGLGTIVLWLWNTALSPLVDFILGALKNAFEVLTDALSVIAGWFEKVGGWANTAKDYIGKFADMIAGIKLPDWVTNGISTVVTTVGKVIGAKPDGSHYHGLDSVPYDGYTARLHKNEKILTAQEAKAYDRGMGGNGGVSVQITGPITINKDADIKDIAYQLAKEIEREASRFGFI